MPRPRTRRRINAAVDRYRPRARARSSPCLFARSGIGNSHRLGLGLNRRVERDGQGALPALAGIAHQGCTRGPIEYGFGQSFGPGGLFLKILRGHRCTSWAQVQANAFVPSIFLPDLTLCEAAHLSGLYLSARRRVPRAAFGEFFLRPRQMRFEPAPDPPRQPSMLHILIIIGGFGLIGVACYGFWQGLKLTPYDNIPRSKGSRWRT